MAQVERMSDRKKVIQRRRSGWGECPLLTEFKHLELPVYTCHAEIRPFLPQAILGSQARAAGDCSEEHIYPSHGVTESKVLLLFARQTKQSRAGRGVGAGRATLLGKPADRGDGGLLSQRTI